MQTVKIYTADDLRNFRNRINSGEHDLSAELMNDIDISSYSIGGEPFSWEPIGTTYQDAFFGEFNGNGHTISGLSYVDIRKWSGGRSGLFGFNRGIIKDLTVEGYVRGRSSVGGICGENFRLIENCINKCEVEGDHYTGGVCGYNNGGQIIKCVNFGDVKKSTNIGGIVGQSTNNRIISCRNTGRIFLDYQSLYNYYAFRANDYRVNQIGIIEDMANSNLQNGKVIMPFQNTMAGMYFRYNALLYVKKVADVLQHDDNPEYKNADGDTYLHLLCQNESKVYQPQHFMELLKILATETEIDFAAVNNNGKDAISFLLASPSGRAQRHMAAAVNFIKRVIKDKSRLEPEPDEEIDSFGF